MFVLFICCSSQIIWSDVFDDSIIKDKAGTGQLHLCTQRDLMSDG